MNKSVFLLLANFIQTQKYQIQNGSKQYKLKTKWSERIPN